jgi:hypothetical protein
MQTDPVSSCETLSSASSSGISYSEVAALAYTLSCRISDLSKNKSDSERRRLSLYRDVVRKIQGGLANGGVR